MVWWGSEPPRGPTPSSCVPGLSPALALHCHRYCQHGEDDAVRGCATAKTNFLTEERIKKGKKTSWLETELRCAKLGMCSAQGPCWPARQGWLWGQGCSGAAEVQELMLLDTAQEAPPALKESLSAGRATCCASMEAPRIFILRFILFCFSIDFN